MIGHLIIINILPQMLIMDIYLKMLKVDHID